VATAGLSEATVLAGRYRVERRLGQGGMGAVYLVRHVRTGERLALKLLHASIAGDAHALERFRREAQAPAQIDSDHVARVVDADVAPEIGGAPFLVMEYLRGSDLGQHLAARGRLTPPEVVGYLAQAARALDKAHALGIVHRDLKPENLFLAERDDGTVTLKIVDFGIARVGTAAPQTSTGQMLGTPLYMAPEQITGQSALIGPRTDVWAIGLIAFQLLTGRHYWVFESLPQLALRVTSQPMPAPSTLDAAIGPGFDAWFLRCCARPLEQRFGSVGEAVAALGFALGTAAPAGPAEAYGATQMAPATTAGHAARAYSGPPPVALAGTPAPAHPSSSAQGTLTGSRGNGTRNAVLIVAGVLVLGFGGIVAAIAFFANPFAPGSTDNPSAPTVTPTMAPAQPTRDPCQVSCAKLAECTGIIDPQCETSCKSLPAFAACASREGCPAIAACALGSVCGGKGPEGTMSCRATSDCEGQCVTRGGDTTPCVCGCEHLMAPEHAPELAANNVCSLVRCADACRKPVNGAACLRCFTARCLGESMACRAH
jgi:eukaryotic-like serine/threonine-protein kinase